MKKHKGWISAQKTKIIIYKQINILSVWRMLQRIINYEFATIQHRPPIQYTLNHSIPKTARYNKFNILQTIQQIPDYHSHILRWIGNDDNAHIMSFFYCLIMGCVGEGQQDMFIRVKYCLYGLSEQFLGKDEQKVFVENMCVLQYAKNVVDFLKKAKHFQDLLVKIFHSYRENVASNNNTAIEPIQQLKVYSKIFDFLQFNCYGNRLVCISMPNCQFYIIEQNSCFFVSGKGFAQRVSRINTEKISSLLMRERSKKKYRKRKVNKDRGSSFDTPISPASPMSLFVENQYTTPKFQIPSSNKRLNSLTSSENNDKKIREVDELQSDSSEKRDVLVEEFRKKITEISPAVNKISLKRENLYYKKKGFFESLSKKKNRTSNTPSNSESLHFSPQNKRIESQKFSRILQKQENRRRIIYQSLGSQQKLHRVKKRPLKQKPQPPAFILKKEKKRKKSISPQNNSSNSITVQSSQPTTPKTILMPPVTPPNLHIRFQYTTQKRK